MKLVSVFILFTGLCFPCIAYSKEPSIEVVSFAVKRLLKDANVKDVEYIQGDKFFLGNTTEAYSLFFHGTVNGFRSNIKVNCTADKITGDLKKCKSVKVVKL